MLAKLIKFSAIVFCFLILFVIVGIEFWSIQTRSSLSFAPLIYWAVFLIWIGAVWNFHLDSSFSLRFAFVLFLLSSLLTILSLPDAGETTMRLSLIGWLIGIGLAFLEYNRK